LKTGHLDLFKLLLILATELFLLAPLICYLSRFNFCTVVLVFSSDQQLVAIEQNILSIYLHREVTISVRLPFGYNKALAYPLLLINDGQDFERLKMDTTLISLQKAEAIVPMIAVGVHAGTDRLQEYGTAHKPDYALRGSKAHATTDFVLKELIPFIRQHYSIQNKNLVYAGFSLGGLMAMDIAWNHADVFAKAGIFSGALWWRKKALDAGYDDADRIMHAQIRHSNTKPDLKFWFQTGTQDETDDRDGDGIIGYVWKRDIAYYEMTGGEHNPETWSVAMPVFLKWAFGK
jgi:enterochelin esterase-like enzyme